MPQVRIHYHRPPDRVTVYENELVHSAPEVTITMMRATPLPRPVRFGDEVILEDGAPVVWFTFPDADHDIGRFHTRAGAFTGIYANILTPVEFLSPTEWRTTDLFLDVWVGKDDVAHVLDEEELANAARHGWIDGATASAARASAERLVRAQRAGTWPPKIVYDWPLERIQGMD